MLAGSGSAATSYDAGICLTISARLPDIGDRSSRLRPSRDNTNLRNVGNSPYREGPRVNEVTP
jgi:hypothetical protein